LIAGNSLLTEAATEMTLDRWCFSAFFNFFFNFRQIYVAIGPCRGYIQAAPGVDLGVLVSVSM